MRQPSLSSITSPSAAAYPDLETTNDGMCSLGQLELWLYLAAFVDDDDAGNEIGWNVRDLIRGDATRSSIWRKNREAVNEKLIITAPGILDTVETDEEVGVYQSDLYFGSTKFGRPRKVYEAEHIATAKRMRSQGHTAKAVAKYLGVSRATFYRYISEDSTV